jgi:phosphatidylglycerophosphate synthase
MTTMTFAGRKLSLSLRELRAVAQPPEYSPSRTDALYRLCSIYLSIPLARLGATPNGITLAWIAIGFGGVAALAVPSWPVQVAGALLLQLSYLLDFVDGEVARLTGRRSRVGEFLDLLGHGLLKTSLPLALGVAAAAAGGPLFLVAGAIGAVAIGVGDSLRFYAACASGDLGAGDLAHVVVERVRGRRFFRALLALFKLSFESPGLYALILAGAAAGRLDVVSGYFAAGGVLWLTLRSVQYSRRIGRKGQVSGNGCAPRAA